MRNLLRGILMVCWLLPLWASAQVETIDFKLPEGIVKDSTFKIEYIVTNTRIPGYLDIHIRYMMQDTVASTKYLEDSLQLSEMGISGPVPLEKHKVFAQRFDVVTVLIDISSSMWRTVNGKEIYMDSAKTIVDSLMRQLEAPYSAKIYTFDENWYERTLDGETSFRNVKRPVTARYTHLYENVAQALDRMADAKGRKLLIIVGDGENDHNKKLPVKITRQDLLEKIRGLDDSYVIFPIALGAEVYDLNLSQIVGASKNRQDSTIHGMPGPGLFQEFRELKRWPVTHTIMVKSNSFPHVGRERFVAGRLGAMSDTCSYRLGGLYNPWNEQSKWQLDSLIGGAFIIALLVVFAVYIPRRRWKDFRSKYVKQYWEVKQEGLRKYDPLTKFPFRDDDFVVVRCEHMTSLETWQFEGRKGGKDGGNRKRKNRCIYYPNKCESGHGPGGSADFFSQHGAFKQLFWVFMAALGAMIGWGFWALFEVNKKVYWNATLDSLASSDWVQTNWGLQGNGMSMEDSVRVAREGLLNPFFEQLVLVGILAAFITFLIAISYEIGQARGGIGALNMLKAIWNSALRGIVAGLLGILIFAGYGYVTAFVATHRPYFPGLLALMLLGAAMGRVLTFRTGIRNSRGLWAGLLAGLVGFHVYFLPMLIYHTRGYEGPKMFAFIVFGAVLALFLSLGSPSLEASELEIWTQRKRYGKVHVTDLLRKNEDVTIGRGATATVRMKVRYTLAHNAPGNATQTFAELSLRNEVVMATPLIFMEVNGEPVAPGEKVVLFDGDKITFDHTSPSHLIYREHRSGPHPKWRLRNRRNRRLRKEAEKEEARIAALKAEEAARIAAEEAAKKKAAEEEAARKAAEAKALADAKEAERAAAEAARIAAEEEAARVIAEKEAAAKAAADELAKAEAAKEALAMAAAEKEAERIAEENARRVSEVERIADLAAAERDAQKEAEDAAKLAEAEKRLAELPEEEAEKRDSEPQTPNEDVVNNDSIALLEEDKDDDIEIAEAPKAENDDAKSEIPEISSMIDNILGGGSLSSIEPSDFDDDDDSPEDKA